ncbi:penicillin amidase [Aliiroseovarius halocynthiae]|uniref:Penicillin acylase family protein n=1 Tax=Aliiroseovarius halocynthiae TaxID=985055 RepID=A0A545SWB0_9RHOB|nr:penicillin acylase family protein [Aliiroseovarius halocynthiae]TQV69253.1 penicillin acylase family protein [Aliiroseovarius halocynthiae]SMR72024.1 penicillin amidase [Aliiroseovarius halocynthiae]
MGRIILWMIRGIAALVVIAVLLSGMVYYLASQSLPDYDVTRETPGITAPVEIVRNNANIPHILGENDSDVFFGLGYAHAQDRLWQMIIMRRTVQGRLSEVFGRRTLKTDELLRRLDLYNLARASLEYQDDDTKMALEAYASGVNAYLSRVNTEALGRGAPEFFLFSNEISPWQPADSLAILKLMGLQLAGHLEDEVLRARVSLTLPEDRVRDILPDMPGHGIAALPEYASFFDQAAPQFASLGEQDRPAMWPSPRRGFAGASNGWAAAPTRSAAGGTLLANDPHLGFSAPAIWYLARLELQTGGVIGGTIPGMPLILAGRSDSFGYGITSSYLDDQDLHLEQLNPDNPDEIRTPDGFTPITTRASIVRIKDEAPITLTLQWTPNGPILPPEMYDLGLITPVGHAMSLSWTLLTEKDRSMSAGIGLMRAKTVMEGIAAGADYVAPSQTLTMVDKDSIAMKVIGVMPGRNPRNQTQGRIPSPAWNAVNLWGTPLSYSANPKFVQPTGGIVGNTNNKIIDRPFPEHMSFNWGDSQRIQRWQRLMQAREVHTRDSFIEAQLDTVSVTARTLLPLVAADLWFTGEAAPAGTQDRNRQDALTLLANWNGEMNEHMPEPLIYSAWMRALQSRLIRDELGPLATAFKHVDPVFVERVYRDVDTASVWCDVIQSAARETCSDIALVALDDALLWLSENARGKQESLRWGDYHLAVHKHATLGEVPFLKWFVNIRQSTSGGDNTLLRGLTSGVGKNPFQNVHGAAYRGIYDFSDPDSSLFVISTGQSGHPLSRHYDDLGELWRRGEFTPMSLDPELARAAAVGITHLIPIN